METSALNVPDGTSLCWIRSTRNITHYIRAIIDNCLLVSIQSRWYPYMLLYQVKYSMNWQLVLHWNNQSLSIYGGCGDTTSLSFIENCALHAGTQRLHDHLRIGSAILIGHTNIRGMPLSVSKLRALCVTSPTLGTAKCTHQASYQQEATSVRSGPWCVSSNHFHFHCQHSSFAMAIIIPTTCWRPEPDCIIDGW